MATTDPQFTFAVNGQAARISASPATPLACPTCGDIAHPSASRCESCAAPLFERDVYLGHLRLSRDRLGRFLKKNSE